ncbi:hypothetical protein LINPERHAP1_LOCUS9739 [Linum perenne]
MISSCRVWTNPVTLPTRSDPRLHSSMLTESRGLTR